METYGSEFGRVRVVMDGDIPWFSGKDICEAIGFYNVNQALVLLERSERSVLKVGSRTEQVVNESGVYGLISMSKKREVKKFRFWVTNVLLPEVRVGVDQLSMDISEQIAGIGSDVDIVPVSVSEGKQVEVLDAIQTGNEKGCKISQQFNSGQGRGLRVFEHEEFGKVRVVVKDGEPWFSAKDVARALDYPESSLNQVNNLFGHIPSEWKRKEKIKSSQIVDFVGTHNRIVDEESHTRRLLVLSEQGLYFFIGRSDKVKAIEYQKWLAGTVMPSIRKHGENVGQKEIGVRESKSDIRQFEGEFGNVRVIMEGDKPLFVAKDIVEALGLVWKGTAAIDHVPSEWIWVTQNVTQNYQREVHCLTEEGVNFFVIKSKSPKALPVQKWLAGTVMPSIRKHGVYMTPLTLEKSIADPTYAIGLLTALKEEQEARKVVEQKNNELVRIAIENKPKVVFADTVINTAHTWSVAEAANYIQPYTLVKMGQRHLYQYFRDNGWVCKEAGRWNKPTKKALKQGLLIQHLEDDWLDTVTRVTGKGLAYFINKFRGLSGKEFQGMGVK